VLEPTDRTDRIRDVDEQRGERTESTGSHASDRAGASLESGRKHLEEMTSSYLRGSHALHDLEEAVTDFALIGRTTGVPPEELLASMKEICEPVWSSPNYSPVEMAEVRDQLVKQLIGTYFPERP
jgi:hypothetical protein